MKTAVFVLTLATVLPARIEAQRYDYHLLLDSTVPAASAALVGTGHRGERTVRRADGMTQQSFATVLPDSSGTAAAGELEVLMVSQADRITRIGVRAAGRGADSASVKTAAWFFVQRLTAAFGRPLASADGSNWCWSTRTRFIDLTLDRDGGELSLSLAYGPQGR